MNSILAEQFKSCLLPSEAVLWCGRPEIYRPQVHIPPIYVGFGIMTIFSLMPGSIFVKMIVVLFLSSPILYFLCRQAKSDVSLVFTNKRLLVFNGRRQLLRTSELKEVQIKRLSKDVFIVIEKLGDNETIKWPCVCNEHPELLAIELQKLGVK